jgi:superoxide reductase
MVEKNSVFKCDLCGNIISVFHASFGELVCCGKPMRLLLDNVVDASFEKHVPVIEKKGNGFFVSVGSILHPMTSDHHIEWVELFVDGFVFRKDFVVGDEPKTFFCVDFGEKVFARAYCNLHGLWKK